MATIGQKSTELCRLFSKYTQSVGRNSKCILPVNRPYLFRNVSTSSKPEPNPRSRRLLLMFGLGAGTGLAFHLLPSFTKPSKKDVVPKVDAATVESDGTSRRHQMNFIADIVEVASPAVVYIEIQGRHPFTGRQEAVSNGSGFIVREDGLVLTNAHVVANKATVKVKLQDGRLLEGVVQAVDPVSDLATVKIDATNLPTLKLGKSSDIRPGEWVVAMGSPFQLSNTVTAGIVSTVNRGSKELGLQKDMDYIQTDATINFGNSGGPLINLDGEAIGINTMKVTTGISFAIPSDYARQFLEKASKIENRKSGGSWFGGSRAPGSQQVVPPVGGKRYLGITMLTLTPPIIQELRIRQEGSFPTDVEAGVLIHRVVIDSPAYRGGIHPGDIITHINGNQVKAATDVYKAVDSDADLELVIRRGKSSVSLTVSPEVVQGY